MVLSMKRSMQARSTRRAPQQARQSARPSVRPASRPLPVPVRATRADEVPRRALAQREMQASFNYSLRQKGVPKVPESDNPITDFVSKLKLAWNIFFPDKPAQMSPKDTGKQRLRMILVADRCGMSPASMSTMKRTIVKALSDFVDIESDADIEVSISNEPQLGTIYCVAIPISRVKPDAKLPPELAGEGDGVTLEWDPENYDSDPSGRFPMGT